MFCSDAFTSSALRVFSPQSGLTHSRSAGTARSAARSDSAISEVLGGLPIETDDDLHEIRQSDAYYAAAPHYGEHGSITWMPTSERAFAEPGAESFEDVLGRELGWDDAQIESQLGAWQSEAVAEGLAPSGVAAG